VKLRRSVFWRVLFVIGLGLACAAPTPGDVGGCGQRPDNLDGPTFFERKRAIDCEKCASCRFDTQFCSDECAANYVAPSLPDGCVPLVHDGEVCLDALAAAGCDEYADYTSDTDRLSPSECQFCPAAGP
jgi:hypothetical protein